MSLGIFIEWIIVSRRFAIKIRKILRFISLAKMTYHFNPSIECLCNYLVIAEKDIALFCLSDFLFKVCLTQSADLSVFVLFFLFFYYSFLFFSTATCVLRFLPYFSTNLDEIWHVDSPWWDEQTEYFFKSIGPRVGIKRGPKVLLCFIIGKTLYTVRRDKNFT